MHLGSNMWQNVDLNITLAGVEVTLFDNGSYQNAANNIVSQIGNSGGGMPGWANEMNNVVNAFMFGNGVKTELIDFAVRRNFKSARTASQFNNLRKTQKAWRYNHTLGKTGVNYLKYSKALGTAGAVLSTSYSVSNMVNYYNNGGQGSDVMVKTGLDVAMTIVGFMGPIGFTISATYFILDAATDGFGGFGSTN